MDFLPCSPGRSVLCHSKKRGVLGFTARTGKATTDHVDMDIPTLSVPLGACGGLGRRFFIRAALFLGGFQAGIPGRLCPDRGLKRPVFNLAFHEQM